MDEIRETFVKSFSFSFLCFIQSNSRRYILSLFAFDFHFNCHKVSPLFHSFQVQNLDDLHHRHTDYLNKAIFRSLLNKKASPVMKIISDIFSLVLKLHTQLMSAPWQQHQQTGHVTHPAYGIMCSTMKSFKDCSRFLFTGKEWSWGEMFRPSCDSCMELDTLCRKLVDFFVAITLFVVVWVYIYSFLFLSSFLPSFLPSSFLLLSFFLSFFLSFSLSLSVRLSFLPPFPSLPFPSFLPSFLPSFVFVTVCEQS